MNMIHFHPFLPTNSHTLLLFLRKVVSQFVLTPKSIFIFISVVLSECMFSIFQIYFHETFNENFFS